MTKLEKIRQIIQEFPGYDILKEFRVDYTDQVPANAGIFPAGLVELERRTDILGSTEVTNQLNFALYVVLNKADGDDELATINADWIMDFSEYIQERSIRKDYEPFGDDIQKETITATDGHLYQATDEGLGIYAVEIAVQYMRKFDA